MHGTYNIATTFIINDGSNLISTVTPAVALDMMKHMEMMAHAV